MTKPEKPPVVRKLHKVGFYKLNGRLLGKGNFARVEEAIHTLLHTKVAIKVLDTSKIKEQYVAKHLDREARILAKLQHPSIVCLYETMRVGPMYYLVTELATGGDLCTYIKRHKTGRLDERLAKRFGRQLISAIAHMHHRGIVHRDLKMENIMLDSNRENVKIVDFGLSNTWSPATMLQTHCGSPEYAAPELFIVGKRYGPEVDLWSLGVVLYGMITGRLPFLTPRDDSVSTQERRRRLLMQINRGLTLQQCKPLNDSSTDFRNLVTRLLAPKVASRITLDELMFHPWITSRQKKILHDVSSSKPTSIEHANMICRIADLVHLPHFHVEMELAANRHGPLGGMYNILTHINCMVRCETNGVTWSSLGNGRSCSATRYPQQITPSRPPQSYDNAWSQPVIRPTQSSTHTSPTVRPKTSPGNRGHSQTAPIKIQTSMAWGEQSAPLHSSGRDSWLKSGGSSLSPQSKSTVRPTVRPRSKTPSPGPTKALPATLQPRPYTSEGVAQLLGNSLGGYLEKQTFNPAQIILNKKGNSMRQNSTQNNTYAGRHTAGHARGTSPSMSPIRNSSKESLQRIKQIQWLESMLPTKPSSQAGVRTHPPGNGIGTVRRECR